MNKTFNKDGSLTRYAFSCGDVEVYSIKGQENGIRISLEHETFHVKGFFGKEWIYKVFSKIGEARKYARQYGKLK